MALTDKTVLLVGARKREIASVLKRLTAEIDEHTATLAALEARRTALLSELADISVDVTAAMETTVADKLAAEI